MYPSSALRKDVAIYILKATEQASVTPENPRLDTAVRTLNAVYAEPLAPVTRMTSGGP